MTDWTIIATSAIAASSGLAGAVVGFLAARTQAVSELERLRIEHEEAHLRHRQGVYHDYLDTAHRFHQDIGGTEPLESVEERHELLRVFEHRLTAVSLFGTEPAWRAAQELANVIGRALGASPTEYVKEHEQAFLEGWEKVIKAMRPDTAPGERSGRAKRP